MMKTVEDLFKALADNKALSFGILRGEDPYLERELKKKYRENGWDIESKDLGKTGPDASVEVLFSGASLFSSGSLVWLKSKQGLSSWSKEAHGYWQKITSLCDGNSNALFLQVPNDKRLKWSALKAEFLVELKVDDSARKRWIKRMVREHKADLGADKIDFLRMLDEELLVLDQYVELWALGGDAWAKKSLAWGELRDLGLPSTNNPAFAWVDAVLMGKRSLALKLLKKLFDDGQDAFQLMGLLNKSVRIVAQLEVGIEVTGESPWLLKKLQSQKGRGRILLQRLSKIDKMLKSSPTDPRAALASLT